MIILIVPRFLIQVVGTNYNYRSNPGPGRGQSRRVGFNQARRRYLSVFYQSHPSYFYSHPPTGPY